MTRRKYRTFYKILKEDIHVRGDKRHWQKGRVVFARGIKEAFELAESLYGNHVKAEVIDEEAETQGQD